MSPSAHDRVATPPVAEAAAGRSDLTIPLDALGDAPVAAVGGKARGLGEALAAGFPVPEGFVLTTAAFRRAIAAAGLAPALRDLEALAAAGPVDGPSPRRLEELRAAIARAPLPPDVDAALGAAVARAFGPDPDVPLAVRSSGVQEDLEEASFAGLYETVLGVRGADALADAIRRCWASAFDPRVLEYARRRAGGAREVAVAVIVQRLVEAEVAGVLFTVNPLDGREEEMVIEAVFGLGDALVAGRAPADRFVVDAATGRARAREIANAEAAARGATLDEGDLRALADLGARLQERFGRPLDVEWARAGGRFSILQARPITKISFAPELGEWTTADFRDGGIASGVCSPFMWSLYELALERSMPRYFEAIRLLEPGRGTKWGRMFFGRPYWNLGEVKRVLMKIPGFDERHFDEDLGVEVAYEGPGRKTPVTLRGILGALPVLFALKRSYREQLEIDRRLVAAFEERRRPYDLDAAALRALDRAELARRYGELLHGLFFETETAYFTTIYNTSNSMIDLKEQLAKASRAAGAALDPLALMGGLEGLSHMKPVEELFDLAGRLAREQRPVDDETVRAFAERWRHRGRRELDIRVPRWRDDHGFVRTMIEEAVATHDPSRDPAEKARRQRERYLAELDRARRALRFRPLARRAFERALDLVRTYAWWREEMRDRSTRVYDLIRLWSVEVARRLVAEGALEAEEGLWDLRFQDALAALEGRLSQAEARRLAAAGRRMVRSFRNFRNPTEVGAGHRLPGEAPAAGAAPAATLRGTGASPGRARGRARVVRSIAETGKVAPGDVLVTVFTDPGWTALLSRVAAVVTETGGVLCHAAVISREYGIPAVLSVPEATAVIPDGATIAVDGSAGTVEIVAPPAERSGT